MELTIQEAAQRLRLSTRTVYRLVESGAINGVKVGGQWRVPPSAVVQLAGRAGEALSSDARGALDAAVDHLAARVLADTFETYFTEGDLAAAHVADLRERLSPGEFEVHMGLAVAGSGPRETPDVSVLPRLKPWAERRGAAAVYSAGFKDFSYRGTSGGYRLTDGEFRRLLSDIEQQYARLAQRIEAGILAVGLVMWVDAFDWLGRLKDEGARRAIVEERAAWFRERFARPASHVRAEYLPVRYPELRVSLSNGFAGAEGAAEVRRHSDSLFGAAKPFIRQTPPPEEEWDDLIAQSAVDDYLAGEGSG